MDSSSSNEDEEGKVCTVSSSSTHANPNNKSTFDTIAFTAPKKEQLPTSPSLFTPPSDPYVSTPTAAMSKTNSMVSMLADDLQSGDPLASGRSIGNSAESGSVPYDYSEFPRSSAIGNPEGGKRSTIGASHVTICVFDDGDDPLQTQISEFINEPSMAGAGSDEIIERLETLELGGVPVHPRNAEPDQGSPSASTLHQDEIVQPIIYKPSESVHGQNVFQGVGIIPAALPVEPDTEIPSEFRVKPDEDFAVEFPTIGMVVGSKSNEDTLHTWREYTPEDASYHAWIPSEETRKVLSSIASDILSGTHVPDKEHMTMPGIILEDDLVDKVGVNVKRIFGSPEAVRRKPFTADNVTQDDNGLRELIKLGCYRAAINLTKRLLVFYGQGPGKVGHYSKHTPHSLQLWFLRISLLVRIREFSTAESELEAFKGFDKPDMYYDYYPTTSCQSLKGSMVPFHFRILAAEIPQYTRKFNETINKLYDIHFRVQQILGKLSKGLGEDGGQVGLDDEQRSKSKGIWEKRQVRVLYSLTNSSLFSKDYHNAFNFLTQLCEKDSGHLPQLKSALGRLFLQHGDITTAETYFHEASELRSDSDGDQVDSLVDSALTAISQNLYGEAIEFLKQALMLQPENFMITNNLAVCHLYLGNVKESLALMETTVKQNMPQSLQENVILNLCSIYELENSDGSKKLGLLKLISEYKGDGINLASLKLSDLI